MVGEVVVITMEVNGVRDGEANSTSPLQGDAGVRDHAERRVTGGGYEENLRMTFAMTTDGC